MCPRRQLAGVKLLTACGLAIPAITVPSLCQTISIPASISGRGGSLPVPVIFANPGQPVSGLQFDIQYDPSVLLLVPVIGSASRNSAKSLYVAPLAPGKSRFLIWQMNQSAIQSGAVITIFVNVKENAAIGNAAMHFENALAADSHGRPVPVTASDGSLAILSSSGQSLVPQGVLNAATLLPGPVAAGELITIVSTAINSAPESNRILFDGIKAPLIRTSTGQADAVVPFSIAGRNTTTLVISNSAVSASLSLPVASVVPGVFTRTGSGTGPGALLNEDSSLNSPGNPAGRGSIITFYGTGTGQTYPPGIDGLIPTSILPKPLNSIAVYIGDSPAEILYAGAAPGQISGMVQVNCRVPIQAPTGNSIPLVMTAGQTASPPVTVAIK